MKKKFLSLMMAAAVVATTSVSAFAAENVQVTTPKSANVTDLDSNSPTQKIDITGHVQNTKGEMPAARFNVTIPTAANFTVTNKGKLIGPDLTIKNEGTQGVDVYAYSFSNTGDGGITVTSEDNVTNDGGSNVPRTTVSLRLLVDEKPIAYLGADSQNSKEGVYNGADLVTKAPEGGIKLLSLEAGADEVQEKKITIAGTAGKKAELANPVSDTFKLVLKITKTPVTPVAAR